VSTTSCTTLPRKHVPPGKPPSAGTPPGPTSSQSGGSPKFDRSEHRASRIAWICSGRVGFRSTPSALLRDAVLLRGVLDSEDRVDADSGVDGEHGRGSQACPENAPSAECPATQHARNRHDDHGVGNEHGNERGNPVHDPAATRDPAGDVTHDAPTAPLVDLL